MLVLRCDETPFLRLGLFRSSCVCDVSFKSFCPAPRVIPSRDDALCFQVMKLMIFVIFFGLFVSLDAVFVIFCVLLAQLPQLPYQ